MSEVVIKIENLSKQYKLGQISTGTLYKDLNKWWARRQKKADPYQAVDTKQTNSNEYFWALDDVSFDVNKGDVLGIIGKNGAGKSTLLKLLSRITSPTQGGIKVKGRIASLLEVGTGFHPELTGRENIYLNGAILGMRRNEIRNKFDEIVTFSGIEKYIDTPVKRYSSGMYVRLAFAVAAHLESEILIIDEVLAVGDAEFQKKCLGKMGDVAKNDGRTVLFVSHNMAAVSSLCNKGLLLKKGKRVNFGNITSVIQAYQEMDVINRNAISYQDSTTVLGNENIKLLSFNVSPKLSGYNTINIDSGVKFEISFVNFCSGLSQDCTVELRRMDDVILFHLPCVFSKNNDSQKGIYTIMGYIDPYILNAGIYKFKLIFGQNRYYALCILDDIISFEVENTSTFLEDIHEASPGFIRPSLNWKINFQKIEQLF